MATKVQDQSPEVAQMAQKWAISDALLGGTAAMRSAGEAFLPKWPNEERESYDARLKTATLFPAFRRTIGVMAGKPFSKQLTFGNDVPEVIREYCENIDLEGHNLHAFGCNILQEVLGYGICGVLVDYPKVTPARTVADEKSIGARPYMVFIRHSQILGWQTARINGVLTLTQLRLAETGEEQDGPYGVQSIKRVRVLEPGRWQLWQETDKHEYTLIEEGTTTLSAIPFVPFYGVRKSFMVGESPLIDLAYLNVKHWQSQSDQDTIMHVSRVPILTVIGAEQDTKVTVGASSAVALPIGADMKFVEHSGAAIAAGEKSLEALEAQMIQTGAELLVQKPDGQKTATQANNDAEANKSDLQRITESFEDSIDQALQFVAMWRGLPDGGHVSLFKDFAVGSLSDASAQLIVTMQQGGLISKETAIREQQRRGTLAPDLVPEDELALVDAQGPALGAMGEGDKADIGDSSAVQAQEPPVDLAPVLNAISAQPDMTAAIAGIMAKIEAIKPDPVDLSPITAQIADISAQVSALKDDGAIKELQSQIAALAAKTVAPDLERLQASIMRDVQAAIAAIPAPQSQAPVIFSTGSGAKIIDLTRGDDGSITGAKVREA